MAKRKRIIWYLILEIIEVICLVLGYFYSKIFMWIFIGIAVITVFFFLFFLWLEKSGKKLPECEWKRVRQQLVRFGKRCNFLMSECEINTRYSDKKEMERYSHMQLPDFRVVSCKETKPDHTGSYTGQMEIEFCEDFLPETQIKIRTGYSGNKIVLKSFASNVTGEWWNLQLSSDFKTAVINYGYTDLTCP